MLKVQFKVDEYRIVICKMGADTLEDFFWTTTHCCGTNIFIVRMYKSTAVNEHSFKGITLQKLIHRFKNMDTLDNLFALKSRTFNI